MLHVPPRHCRPRPLQFVLLWLPMQVVLLLQLLYLLGDIGPAMPGITPEFCE